MRARIFLARANGEGAAAEAARGLELARAAKDAQVVRGLLGATLTVQWSLGLADAARATARELISLLEHEKGPWGALDLAHLAAELDLVDEANPVVTLFQDNLQLRGARALLDCDPERAVELFEAAEDKTLAAEARLYTARSLLRQGRHADADVHLRHALAFFRSVGATRYVRSRRPCSRLRAKAPPRARTCSHVADEGWSLCGAPLLQPVATGRKLSRRGTAKNMNVWTRIKLAEGAMPKEVEALR